MPSPTAFYPSILATLRIRFDEVYAPLLGLQLTEQPTTRELAAARTFDPASALRKSNLPLLMTGVKDSLSRVFNVQPRSSTVTLETYRRASTFSMEFDYSRIPIDPRLLRSAAIEIYLDAVPPPQFADGMIAGTPAGTPGAQPRLGTLTPSPDNLLFVGTIDEWEAEHDSEGSWVKIEGRDLRAIFLDSPADSALFQDLDVSKPIDDVVRQILARHPMGEAFRDAVKAVEWPNGKIPSPYTKDGVTRVRIPADTTINPKSGNVRPTPKADPNQINFWDLITQYCYLVGAIPYFHGPELRIRPVRPLYETVEKAGFDPNVPTPFKNGSQRDILEGDPPVMVPYGIRKMVFGRNVGKVRIKRRFNGYRPRVIECVSLDTSSKNRGADKLLLAAWDGTQDPWDDGTGIGTVKKRNNQHHKPKYVKTNVSPSGFRSEAEVLRVSVPGVRDVTRLREIAKAIFEEIGRGEISGYCETRDLASYAAVEGQGGNDDPDLLRLRPGDPIEFLTDATAFRPDSPVAHELVSQVAAPFAEVVERIAHSLGGAQPTQGDYNFARVLVASSRKMADIQSFFRVTTARFTFDQGGLSINFDFQNYVEARFNERKDAPAAQDLGAKIEKGIGPFPGSGKQATPGKVPSPATSGAGATRTTLRDTLKQSVRKAAEVKRNTVPRAVPAAPPGAHRPRHGLTQEEIDRQELMDRTYGFRWEYDEAVADARRGPDEDD